jgi:hypothetical protein
MQNPQHRRRGEHPGRCHDVDQHARVGRGGETLSIGVDEAMADRVDQDAAVPPSRVVGGLGDEPVGSFRRERTVR